LMIWPSLNRLVFITPKIKNYPFHCFRITGGIHIYKLEDPQKAKTALVDWIKRAQDSSIEYFQSVAESLIAHWERIVGFFTNRSTNAHAESLNAQIKLFRSNLRGVTDTKFFLYRLEKIFA
jgi:transposase